MATRDRWFPQLEGKPNVEYPVAQAIRRAFELLYDIQDTSAINLEGVHGDRDTKFPATDYELGITFWETDRLTLYRVSDGGGGDKVWRYVAGIYSDVNGQMPADLAENDEGFLFLMSDYDNLFRWIGTGWEWITGIHRAAIASIPTADLGTDHTGFLFYATDYFHTWRWSGSAWSFAPGDSGSKFIVGGIAVPLGGLWQLCDGTVVAVAHDDATIPNITTPDLTGDIFLKGGAYSGTRQVATPGTWDAAAVTDDESTHTHTGPSHTHPIDQHIHGLTNEDVASGAGATVADSGNTDAGGALNTNAGGTGATGAGDAHSHALSDANAVLEAPSESDGGLPLRMNLAWYMRR